MKSIYYSLTLIIIIFYSISVFAQRTYETNPDAKRANIWYFGQNAGINFNTNPPTSLSDGKVDNIEEGGGVMCDTNGNILFYTDGRTVWNKNHDTMENGFGLSGGYSASQTGLCLKHPDNDSLFYIFNSPYSYDHSDGLTYSIINIKSNNQLGKVVLKNIRLNNNSSEKIGATYHSNGKDIWIIGHEYGNNRFFKFLLKKDGILNCPTYQDTGVVYYYLFPPESNKFINQGFIKFSPDNKYMIHLFTPESVQSQYRRFELYEFNNENGYLSSKVDVSYTKMTWNADFSHNSKNIIFSDLDSFTTYYNIYTKQKKQSNKIKLDLGERYNISIAPNDLLLYGRIDSSYIGQFQNSNNFNFISSQEKFINITPGIMKYSFPNIFMGYIQKPSINFTYNFNCHSNSIQLNGLDTFYATNFKWIIYKSSINNPINSAFTKNHLYIFKDTGKYNICFIASTGAIKDTIIKSIYIYPKINKNFLGTDTAFEVGIPFNKILKSPDKIHCQSWYYLDTLRSSSTNYSATQKGTYICKVTSKAFCEVWDTIIINDCINNLQEPSLFRSRDTLRTWHLNADSFVWYRNNQFYKVTKQPFLALIDTGTYRVEAAKKGHCNRSSVGQLIVNKLSVNNISIEDLNIRIYPNPNNGILNIFNSNNTTMPFEITNCLGQKVYYDKIINGNNIFKLNLSNGIYIISFYNHNIVNQKLIIQ